MKRNPRLRLCIAVLAAVALFAPACRTGAIILPPSDSDCIVERVSDGDTIRVSGCLDGSVRLLLIDTPEIAHIQGGTATPDQCFGPEAKRYVESRLPRGTLVRLEAGVRDKDQFGRYLRYVWIGDELLNETLVRQGYAARYRAAEDRTYESRIAAAESGARAARRGRWGACPP